MFDIFPGSTMEEYLDLMRNVFSPRWPDSVDESTKMYAAVQPPFPDFEFTAEQLQEIWKVFKITDFEEHSLPEEDRTEYVYLLCITTPKYLSQDEIRDFWNILTSPQQKKFRTIAAMYKKI